MPPPTTHRATADYLLVVLPTTPPPTTTPTSIILITIDPPALSYVTVSYVSKDSSMLDGLANASTEMEEAKARLNDIITSGVLTSHSDGSPEFPWMVDGAGLPLNAAELLPKLVPIIRIPYRMKD